MKKKRYKSLIAIGLAAAMTLTNAPMITMAEEIALDNVEPVVTEVSEPEVQATSYTVAKTQIGNTGVYWALTPDGTLEIGGSGDPKINATILNKTPWYDFRTSIRTVSIADTVKPINVDCWFQDCTFLVNPPAIPYGVQSCQGTFYGCSSLKTAPIIPNSVTDGSNMFNDCSSLQIPPTIPLGLYICMGMFQGCSNLEGNILVLSDPGFSSVNYSSMFSGVKKPITLYYAGNCTKSAADAMAATGTNITVKAANGKNVVLSNTSAAIRVGSSTKLSYTYDGYETRKSWASSNTSVATVDSNGTVTAVKPGTATMTLTVKNYVGDTITKTCTVTVSDVAPVITSQPSAVSTTPGNAVTFKVTASGTNNKYQWYMANDMITTGSPISEAASATYTIPSGSVTSDLDGKYFYCVVSNEGNSPVSSARAKLSVITSPTIPTFKANIAANSWANSSVTIELMGSTINGATDNVGYKYSIDGGVTWTIYDKAFVWDTDTESATIQAKAYNKIYPSTESEIVKFIIKYDATAPLIKSVAVNDRTITIDANDVTSGVSAYAITQSLTETPVWGTDATFTADYGTYYVHVKDNAGNVAVYNEAVTLEKGASQCSVEMSDWTYGEAASEPVITSSTNPTDNAVISYYNGETKLEEKPSVPGTYKVVVTLPETETQDEVIATALFVIQNGTLLITTADYKGTYDKTAHSPSVLCDGATMKSGMTAGTYDLTEMPSFTDVGSYTVYYEAAKEYYNTVTGSVNVVIEKAAGIPENKPASVMTVPYTIKSVKDVSLNAYEGWTWEIADVDLVVGVPYTAVATYAGEDAGNYTETSANVVITRESCEHPEDMKESHEGLMPTCTEKGYTAYTICTQCEEYLLEKESLNATGHTWDSGVVTKSATASEDGSKVFTCSSCGKKRTEVLKYSLPDVVINKDEDEEATLQEVVSTPSGTVTVWKNIDNTYKVIYNAPADKNITNVTIPETVIVDGKTYLVTEVANNAFNGCEKLKEVTIGKNVTSIGKNAFRNCKQLTSVNIDNAALLVIKEGAFNGCKALKSIVIPVNVKEIGDNAFKNCKKLQTVTMKSKALEIIGDNAFNGCEELKSIVIPKPVREIGDSVFKNCKKLTKVSMKTTVLSMLSDNVFYNCKALKSIVIPKGVKEIGDNAFRNCYKLKTVSMKSTALTLIDDNAFYNCKTLKSITIPKTVSKLGDSAFCNCKKLKKITVKTTKLTKKSMEADVFKNVPYNAKVKVPKSKVKSYKKIFVSKGLSKKASVTK